MAKANTFHIGSQSLMARYRGDRSFSGSLSEKRGPCDLTHFDPYPIGWRGASRR